MVGPTLSTFHLSQWTNKQLFNLYSKKADPVDLRAHVIEQLSEIKREKDNRPKKSKKSSKKKSDRKRPTLQNFRSPGWTTPELCALYERKRDKLVDKRLILCDREAVYAKLRGLINKTAKKHRAKKGSAKKASAKKSSKKGSAKKASKKKSSKKKSSKKGSAKKASAKKSSKKGSAKKSSKKGSKKPSSKKGSAKKHGSQHHRKSMSPMYQPSYWATH